MRLFRLLAILLVCWTLTGSCTTVGRMPYDLPDIILWANGSEIWEKGSRLWMKEARKYLKNPVILATHGDQVGPMWVVFPEPPMKPMRIEEAIFYVRVAYPDRPIVLLVCNPGQYNLTIPNVWYALDNVWLFPDNYVKPDLVRETEVGVGSVGTFGEFITYEGVQDDEERNRLFPVGA